MSGSLVFRFLVGFLAPALALFSTVGVIGSRVASNLFEDELGRSLATSAALISSTLSTERVMTLTPEDAADEGSRAYRALWRQLESVQHAASLRRVVVFNTQGHAKIDVGGGLPIDAEVPELLRDRHELESVFGGKNAASEVMFKGNDGKWYKTGYAPLFKDSAVVGAVGVEGSAEFFGPLETLTRIFAGLAALSLLLLGFVALVAVRMVSKPLLTLVSSAQRIGEGDLKTEVPRVPTREIGALGLQLDAMRRAILAREEQLRMMISGVAHEVRNPLGGMTLFLGLLREEVAAPNPNLADVKSHLEKVEGELERLSRLVDDFLVFAREQRLERQPTTLKFVVDSATSPLTGPAKDKRVSLHVEVRDVALVADASLLGAALRNAVLNAIQASTAGATVRLVSRLDGGFVELTVEDSGGGIPPDTLARVFDPFFTTKEKGSGLGLPLSKKIVEAHGGTLSIASTTSGTTVTFRLPVAS